MIEGPVLGIRFNIDKIPSAAYGLESWRVFWKAVDPATIEGALLYDGDTAATLAGEESVFCIAVQAGMAQLRHVSEAVGRSAGFWDLAASSPFIEEAVRGEPLVEAGRIGPGGVLEGGTWSRTALESVRTEATPSPPVCPNCGSLVEPDDNYCNHCGHSLVTAAPPAAAAIPAAVTVAAASAAGTARTARWPWVAAGVGVLVVGAAVAIFAGVFDGEDVAGTGTTSTTVTQPPTSTTRPSTTTTVAMLTAFDVESCLVGSNLPPLMATGQIINRVEAMAVELPTGGAALIFVFDAAADAISGEETLIDFMGGQGDILRFDHVVVVYDTAPDLEIETAIASCSTTGVAIPVTTGAFDEPLAEIETAVGTMLVVDAFTTTEWPPDCDEFGFGCTTSDEERIAVVILEHAKGHGTEAEADLVGDEAFESYLTDDEGFRVDSFVVSWTSPYLQIEVGYSFIVADLPTSLILHWPGGEPIDLTPLLLGD